LHYGCEMPIVKLPKRRLIAGGDLLHQLSI